jgi:hypothetical protein
MATTTTYDAIRDTQSLVLERLVPSQLAEHRFRRGNRSVGLRKWANENPTSAALRTFELRGGAIADSSMNDPGAHQVTQAVRLTVAYPAKPALFGREGLDDLEAIMFEDARQIRDALFGPTQGAYLAGHSVTAVERDTPETSDPVWFSNFTIRLTFTEQQSLARTRDQGLLATDASGTPLAGLAPTWSCLRDVQSATAASEPAITARGDGLYSSQVPMGVAGIVDFGATATPQYVHVSSGFRHMRTVAAYSLATGAPLAGLNPTWDAVITASDGSAVSPQPSFTPLGGGVYRIDGLHPGLCGTVDYGATAYPRYEFIEGTR